VSNSFGWQIRTNEIPRLPDLPPARTIRVIDFQTRFSESAEPQVIHRNPVVNMDDWFDIGGPIWSGGAEDDD
jgi:hypothetical protein